MPGEPIIFLEDIADKMEEASDEWRQFLNIKTGEFLSVQFEHLSLAEDLESDDELAKYSDWERDAIREELKAWKKLQSAEHVAFEGVYNPVGIVFCTEAGEPINPEFISRQFKRDLDQAGLPHIRFHDLRHGHVTQLLELIR